MKRKFLLISLMMFGLTACNPSLIDDSVNPSDDNPSSQSDDTEPEEDTITLTWGQRTDFGEDIQGIKYGHNIRAGAVSLVATNSYEGAFSIELSDITTTPREPGQAKLVDYLSIYVYEGNVNLNPDKSLPTGTVKATITKDTEQKQSFDAIGTPTGTDYTVFVSLDSDAVLKRDEIKNDVVSLEVDWGIA